MHKNKDFKLIFPCEFGYYSPYSYGLIGPIIYPPYGMGVIAAFLRKYGYYVEQEDLSARFNCYNNSFLLFAWKNIDFDIVNNKDEILKFLKSEERKSKLSYIRM